MLFKEKLCVIEAFKPSSDEPSPSWYIEAWENGDIISEENISEDVRGIAVRVDDDEWMVGTLDDWIVRYPNGALDLFDDEVVNQYWEAI